jgi:peptide chain release factor 1
MLAQNRAKAWLILRARLLDRKLQADVAARRAVRRDLVKSADRSDKVRTYNYAQVSDFVHIFELYIILS